MNHEELIDLLERNGLRATIAPISRIDDAIKEIRGLHKAGTLGDGFYNEWMIPYVDVRFPRALRNPKSVLLVSTPAYQRRTTFRVNGRAHEFIVPPTYGRALAARQNIRRIVATVRERDRPKLATVHPPLKLLAVRSGLAMYGRNNITYVPGFGSFQRLSAFYTDVDAPDGQWYDKRALPKCGKCRACLSACPTKAISEDRFLIRAERCLTCMNERSAKHAFPSWVKPSWHNALIGCMICQRACPYDREFLDKIEDGASFSEEETEMILKGKHIGRKGAAVQRKLKSVGVYPEVLPRNLKVLLAKSDAK